MNDDSDILKPCPFCGSVAEFGIVEGDNGDPDIGGHFVGCTNDLCAASTALIFACGDDPNLLLLERWNKRLALNKPSEECNPDDLCAGCRCEYANDEPPATG